MFEDQMNKTGLLMRLFPISDIKLWDRVSSLKFDAFLYVSWKPDLVRVRYSVAIINLQLCLIDLIIQK
jgi:hypothetical protein